MPDLGHNAREPDIRNVEAEGSSPFTSTKAQVRGPRWDPQKIRFSQGPLRVFIAEDLIGQESPDKRVALRRVRSGGFVCLAMTRSQGLDRWGRVVWHRDKRGFLDIRVPPHPFIRASSGLVVPSVWRWRAAAAVVAASSVVLVASGKVILMKASAFRSGSSCDDCRARWQLLLRLRARARESGFAVSPPWFEALERDGEESARSQS